MAALTALAAVLSVGLLVYLGYALLHPERLS
jgi:K+-transporting ATPase KdpF subunit